MGLFDKLKRAFTKEKEETPIEEKNRLNELGKKTKTAFLTKHP